MSPTTFSGSAKFPTTLISEVIHKGETITSLNITLCFSGTIEMRVRTDSNTWEDPGSFITETLKSYTLTNSGTTVEYMIIGLPGAKLLNTYKDDGSYDKPAIEIELIE